MTAREEQHFRETFVLKNALLDTLPEVTDSPFLEWEWSWNHRFDERIRQTVAGVVERRTQHPNQVVLVGDDRSVTADELATMAASIADRLVATGESGPVAVFVDRSPTSVAAIFGVQWAGRCLVPLSADEPAARVAHILDRLESCTVADATESQMRRSADRDIVSLANLPERWMEPVPVASNLPARVLFTSGSTGQPKGVIWAGWQVDTSATVYRERPNARSAYFGPLQWLGGLGGVHATAFNGTARFLDAGTLSPKDVLRELTAYGVQEISVTASLLTSLADEVARSGPLETLRQVGLLGEAATWDSVRLARSLSREGVVVRSVYGASEAVRTLTRIEIHPDEELGSGPLPMGTRTGDHVHLEPVDDELFEIVVKRWVVDGYLGDDELQNQRFGVDANGDRYWRSGDVVSVDDAGTLRFRGRTDDMVKVSGKLAEPSESERVIRSCRGVSKVVVLPTTSTSGRTQLIAHVEVTREASVDEVRGRLAAELPTHLIPAAIVRHDELPVSERGKVDRQTLKSMPVVPWRSDVPRPPRSRMEVFVVREARKLLGIEGLGVHDDLWSYGLDSLGAIELCESLASHLSTTLAVNDFVGASTPAQIADLLSKNRVSRPSHIIDVGVDSDRPPLFVIAGGGSPYLTVRHLASQLGRRWHVYVVEQYGLHQRHRPDRTVRASAERNLADIRRRQPEGPYALVGHSWGGLVAHEMAVILRSEGHDVGLVVLDTVYPLSALTDAERAERMDEWVEAEPSRAHRQTWVTRQRRRLHHIRLSVLGFSDPANRYRKFLYVARRSSRNHRPGVFGAPMLIVDAETSRASTTWTTEPQVRSVRVSGNHVTIVDPPNVTALVGAVDTFLTECLATPARAQGE